MYILYVGDLFLYIGDHFLGMVGEVSDRIQYIFSADQFHEGKTPDPEDTILYEDCLMTRVDQEEFAESGAGAGANLKKKIKLF